VGLGLLSPAVADVFLGGGRAGVVGGVALVVAAGAPTAWRVRRDILDAPGLYAVMTIILLGLVSLVWLETPSDRGPGLEQDDIAAALRLVAVGLVAFGVGARLVSTSQPRQPISFARELASTPGMLMTVFIVALAGVGFAISLRAYGFIADPEASARVAAFQQVLSLLGTLVGLVVLATALTYFATGDRRLRAPLVIFALVKIALGFFVGIKASALEPLVFILLAYVAVRLRLPLKTLAVASILTFVFLVPANLTFRAAVREEQATPSQALRTAISTPPASDLQTAAGSAIDYAFFRFRSIDSIALIQALTPSVFPFADGSKYTLLLPIILVPRAIWTDKPTVSEGGTFAHTYWQIRVKERTSTQLTQIGDLYRNFGYLGVVIGLFCWGIVTSAGLLAYRRWWSPRAEFVYLAALFYAVLNPAGGIETELPQLIATATKTLPLALLVAWLLLPGRGTPPGYRALFGRVGQVRVARG
jgi:hypothetical protein